MLPLFTVITTTYNSGTLFNCVADSIRRQGRDDVEYIVIDGKSTDDTISHVRANADIVTRYISEPDRGIYDAINKGIRLASGKLVLILGSDDALAAGALDALARAYAAQPADLYAGRTLMMGAEGREPQLRADDAYGIGSLVNGIPFGHNALAVMRSAYDRVGLYDASYRLCADANWVHRAIRAGLTCHRLDDVLVEYGESGASSVDPERILAESARVIRSNFPFLTEDESRLVLPAIRRWAAVETLDPILERHRDPEFHRAVNEALGRTPAPTSVAVPAAAPPASRPFFSIVMPAYNVENYIGAALDSILTQSFDDVEVVVVDDGSKDDTPNVLAHYASIDRRVRTFYQANAGQGAARNRALQEARGQYIWCVDSDDFIQTGVLARLKSTIASKNPDLIVVNFAHSYEDGSETPSDRLPPHLASHIVDPLQDERTFAALSCWSCPPWRYVISSRLISAMQPRFPQGLFYEDHPFSISLVAASSRVYVDPSVSYFYRHRAGSTVNVNDRKIYDFLAIRRECISLIGEMALRDRFPNIYLSYVLPIQFFRNHVPGEYRETFLDRLSADTALEELAFSLLHASPDEAELVEALSSRRPMFMSRARHSARDTRLYSNSPAPLDVSSSLREHEVSGLHGAEGPYPSLGLDRVFRWSSQTIELTVRPGDATDLGLRLQFRNNLRHQWIRVRDGAHICFQGEFDADVSVRRELNIPLRNVGPAPRAVVIEMSAIDSTSSRALGVIIEGIDITKSGVVAGLLTDDAKTSTPGGPRLQLGAGSAADHVNLDIRVNPQDRTYLTIGANSDVAGHFVFERGIGEISIGEKSSIGHGCLLICSQSEGIHIGSHVMLSWNVTLMDNDAHSLDADVRLNDAYDWLQGLKANQMGVFKDWGNVRSAPIRIEDHAWIGFGCAILKGVTVGKGAVVGSHSVVTRDVAPYTVVAGNPARFVRLAPRAWWSWPELRAAAAARSDWRDLMVRDGLETPAKDALKLFMASPDWDGLKTLLTQLDQPNVLDLSGSRSVASVALALEGARVTVSELLDWSIDDTGPALPSASAALGAAAKARIRVADLSTALTAGGQYDIIVANQAFARARDTGAVLEQLTAALSPNGILAFTSSLSDQTGEDVLANEFSSFYLLPAKTPMTTIRKQLSELGLTRRADLSAIEAHGRPMRSTVSKPALRRASSHRK